MSRYFNVEAQPNVEHLIRSLSCKTDATILGRAFQGNSAVRKITDEDQKILLQYASILKDEPRARLLSEDELEALLVYGEQKVVYNFIKSEPNGVSEKRIEYLYKKAPTRNANHVKKLQLIYQGRCQICKWDPKNIYGESVCEAHHIHWLSRGGEDSLDNLALLCPNHHKAIHRLDAPFDYEEMMFLFTKHNEKILLNEHLQF